MESSEEEDDFPSIESVTPQSKSEKVTYTFSLSHSPSVWFWENVLVVNTQPNPSVVPKNSMLNWTLTTHTALRFTLRFITYQLCLTLTPDKNYFSWLGVYDFSFPFCFLVHPCAHSKLDSAKRAAFYAESQNMVLSYTVLSGPMLVPVFFCWLIK